LLTSEGVVQNIVEPNARIVQRVERRDDLSRDGDFETVSLCERRASDAEALHVGDGNLIGDGWLAEATAGCPVAGSHGQKVEVIAELGVGVSRERPSEVEEDLKGLALPEPSRFDARFSPKVHSNPEIESLFVPGGVDHSEGRILFVGHPFRQFISLRPRRERAVTRRRRFDEVAGRNRLKEKPWREEQPKPPKKEIPLLRRRKEFGTPTLLRRRKRILASEAKKMKYAIAVDLGGTFIKAGLVAEDGTMTRTRQVPTHAHSGGKVVGEQIAAIARSLYDESEEKSAIVGIGLGSPGLINAEEGIVHFSPNFEGWHDIPLVRYVKDALGELRMLPVFLENDVNAMTLGEVTFGAGRGARYVVGMTLGTGVGGGIVIDGSVYHGASNTAGEIGHMTVLPDGRRCGCGNYGCLEALVGTAGLLERTRAKIAAGARSRLEANLDNLTPRVIADAAKEGDEVAREIFAESGRYIGIVLGSIANLLNPEIAVIGGGISAAGEELLFRHIRDEVNRRAMDVPAQTMRIVPAALGNDAGMAGAATLVFQST